MHKGVILIVKATTSDEAVSAAKEHMDDYGDGDVWDWYVIGGRWSGTLNSRNKEFEVLAKAIVPAGEHGFRSTTDIEAARPKLQAAWESLGETSVNPWSRDQYDKNRLGDDVLPLADCLAVVQDWHQDPVEVGKAEEERAKLWLKSEEDGGRSCSGHPDWNMYGYTLGCAAKMFKQDFSFECNVYNTTMWNFSIPDDPAGFYAVMIDMHN